ncbi:hypothetical protein GQR58_000533 [Nymphon striatum]|nr:hypothetical protein GQR58_000533 [Nymphon striatum]
MLKLLDLCSGSLQSASLANVENSATKAISRVAYSAKRLLKFFLISAIKRVFDELKLRVHVARKGIFSFKVCDRTFLPFVCCWHSKRYSSVTVSCRVHSASSLTN